MADHVPDAEADHSLRNRTTSDRASVRSNSASVSASNRASAADNQAFTNDDGETAGKEAAVDDVAVGTEGGAEVGTEAGNANTTSKNTSELLYSVDDIPAWYMCCFLGLQHYLTMVGATITIPFILTPLMCIDDTDAARGSIVCTIIFVSGLVTLLQSTFGVRLPIVQGGTFSFLVPTIAILTTTFDSCDQLSPDLTPAEKEEEWQVRMREIQGAIAVSAIFQVVIGFTGVIGILLRWITPLAIAPTVALVGLSLFSVAADKASMHWGISGLTMGLMILYSQYLKNIPFPFPAYRKGAGFSISWVYIFRLFPVLLAILMSWGLCAILTASGALSEDSKARTDLTAGLLNDSPWFKIPYPGQWGLPTVSVAGVFGMLAGVLASMIESIGDYYACARIAGAPPPPTHAVNRGIGMEGIGCIMAGLWGTGNGTTSYSENIGAIGVTKVGSRRVVQVGAVIMLLFGMLGKFGAVFVTIPEPVVGGVFCVMFAMITAVGLSSLQYVDLNSSRNLFVLGFSLFMGLAIPKWVESNPNVIQTSYALLDQILTVLLSTSMFIGGFIGFFLDNTVPGTREERGLVAWSAHLTSSKGDKDSGEISNCYDLPIGMDAINKATWTSYLPFSPTFTGFQCYGKNRDDELA